MPEKKHRLKSWFSGETECINFTAIRVGVNSIPQLESQHNSNSNSGIGIGIEIGGIENGTAIEDPRKLCYVRFYFIVYPVKEDMVVLV